MKLNDNNVRYIGKIQRFADDFYRVSENKIVTSEMIMNDVIISNDSNNNYMRGLVRDYKLAQSISRTKATVFEIMMCNAWEFYATYTLDGNKQERNNIEVFRKHFTVWLKNYNTRHNCNIKYIIIPEKHKEGKNFHAHGALMGLPVEHLTAFTLADKLPAKMLNKMKQGREFFNWKAYADKFGFVSLERIRSNEATAIYITKYITKDVDKTGIEVNKRMFYASKGLKRAELIHEGEIMRDYFPDFENDYVKIRTYSTLDEALALFTDETEGGADDE